MEELLLAPTEGDVSNDAIKLMMFPYSLEGSASVWYDKEPPNSILTWEDLETFGEAWERFKEMLRACPHHGFMELTQIDTSYNGLNKNDQDSLNATVGGNLLSTLPSNTIPNPKGEMKAITNRSGVAYERPSIPTNPSPKKVVERETEETTDKEQTNFQGSTAHIQPPVVAIPEPGVPKILPKANISYPSRLNDQRLGKKAMNQMKNFFQIFQDLHFDISFADALLLMPKFASAIKSFLVDKDKFELAKIPLNENCSAMLLKKFLKSLKKLSLPELTPTWMTFKLVDRSITRPKGVTKDVLVKVGKFHFPTDFVVVDFKADPCVPLILGRSFLRTGRALIDVYEEEITLRVNDEAVTFNLNQTTRYSSTYDDMLVNQIDVIDVAREEYAQEMLGFSNFSSGGNSTSTSEPIIFDSSPSLTPFEGKPPELELKDLPSHLEYAYLEGVDKLPMIIAKDLKVNEKEVLLKMLERLAGNEFYCFLDGFFGYFQIPINPLEQEKTTFTCPYGTFSYRRMPFGLCNAPRTFQRCMMSIFHDIIEKTMEEFMDDFLVFGDSFSSCLSHLDTMLQRCEDNNLVLNWEKCHFMVKEGIVLGHKILKNKLEVNRAKVDVIVKVPHPATVKGVRSFYGHAGFYRRFIQDFSKIARPMTHLLEKETPFVFSKDCIDAFETLKKKLTEAPILVVPDWNLPF
uniref:Reverse transcriptase domain-containing protein n=1 Tax=Tanacetum cinerariifolium TaxID=118510 RepID=A0A6L2LHE4_TANCI|nr:reverse transcriptase domain-containing protein [Tanacetum cinerariifolium]